MHPSVGLGQVVDLPEVDRVALAHAINRTQNFSYPAVDIHYVSTAESPTLTISRWEYLYHVVVAGWGAGVTKVVATSHAVSPDGYKELNITRFNASNDEHFLLAIFDQMDADGQLLNDQPLTLSLTCANHSEFELGGAVYTVQDREGKDYLEAGATVVRTAAGFEVTLPHTSAFAAFRGKPLQSPSPEPVGDGGAPFWVWILVALLVAAVLLVGCWLFMRRRSRKSLSDPLTTDEDRRFGTDRQASTTTPSVNDEPAVLRDQVYDSSIEDSPTYLPPTEVSRSPPQLTAVEKGLEGPTFISNSTFQSPPTPAALSLPLVEQGSVESWRQTEPTDAAAPEAKAAASVIVQHSVMREHPFIEVDGATLAAVALPEPKPIAHLEDDQSSQSPDGRKTSIMRAQPLTVPDFELIPSQQSTVVMSTVTLADLRSIDVPRSPYPPPVAPAAGILPETLVMMSVPNSHSFPNTVYGMDQWQAAPPGSHVISIEPPGLPVSQVPEAHRIETVLDMPHR